MSEKDKVIDTFDTLPVQKGYPRPDEPDLEDAQAEEEEENREMEGRTPDLGEVEEDPSEI
jgi:hypothetical protein